MHAQGNVPDRVDVRELAERVLALYWPQVHDFPGPRPYLEQSNDPSKGAVILDAVRELYEAARASAEPRACSGRTPDTRASELGDQPSASFPCWTAPETGASATRR